MVRRRIDSAADHSGGRHRCLYPVYPTHVSADPRSWPRNTTSCRRPWRRRKGSSRCSIRRRPIKNPVTSESRRSSFAGEVEFKDVWLAYNAGENRFSRRFLSACAPGEKSLWSARRAAARHRSSRRFAGSMMSTRGAILVDGIDIRDWDKQQLAPPRWAWCCRTCFFFRRYGHEHHAWRTRASVKSK